MLLQVMVYRELSSKGLHFAKTLDVGKVLSRVFLRLLSDEQCNVEVVKTKSMFIELVDICEERDMLDCTFHQVRLLFSQLGNQRQASVKIRWRLANMRCDNVL
jgi:hypothetical protein